MVDRAPNEDGSLRSLNVHGMFFQRNRRFTMAKTQTEADAIPVAFWCPRKLAEEVDAVVEREMMTRSTWLRRLVAASVRPKADAAA